MHIVVVFVRVVAFESVDLLVVHLPGRRVVAVFHLEVQVETHAKMAGVVVDPIFIANYTLYKANVFVALLQTRFDTVKS